MARIEDVIAAEATVLMDIPGVNGLAETQVDGVLCIAVMVAHSSSELEGSLPTTLQGFPVVIHVAGVIQAQGT